MLSYLDALELEHHGIKGQKWGVRRYQDKDGKLTEAGRKRAELLVNYNAKKAQRHFSKAEKIRKRVEKKDTKRFTISKAILVREIMKGSRYQDEARRLVDAIYPKLKDVPWTDAEKQGIYLDYLNWK